MNLSEIPCFVLFVIYTSFIFEVLWFHYSYARVSFYAQLCLNARFHLILCHLFVMFIWSLVSSTCSECPFVIMFSYVDYFSKFGILCNFTFLVTIKVSYVHVPDLERKLTPAVYCTKIQQEARFGRTVQCVFHILSQPIQLQISGLTKMEINRYRNT